MIATGMIDRSVAVEIPMIGPRLVDLRAEQAAQRTGQTMTEIERLPFDLSALEQDGIFLNVDARNFGLLDRRLDWQALGISLPRTGDVAFRPPRCGLVPDRYRLPLLRPADRAHAALHKFSYHFRLIETVFETPVCRGLRVGRGLLPWPLGCAQPIPGHSSKACTSRRIPARRNVPNSKPCRRDRFGRQARSWCRYPCGCPPSALQ